MRKHSWMTKTGRFFRSATAAVVILALSSLADPLFVYAHNLQTKMVYMFLDPNTQAHARCTHRRLDVREPAQLPFLQIGDELGMIIKVIPARRHHHRRRRPRRLLRAQRRDRSSMPPT